MNLENLKERAVKELSSISNTGELVESLIDRVNELINIANKESNNYGEVFRIGVVTLNKKGLLSPLLITKKEAVERKMFLDTFYNMPIRDTSLCAVMVSGGDYINDMEEHLNDALAQGRNSISSQICIREGIFANMRLPYKAGNCSGIVFLSGSSVGIFSDEIFEFVKDLIPHFQTSLETCNDLDGLLLAQEEATKQTGISVESYAMLHEIQKKLEPDRDELLKNKNMESFYRCISWEGHPSGDLLNIWELDGKTALLILDVSGHGKETAVITIFLRGLFLKESKKNSDPAVVMQSINTELLKFLDKNFESPDTMFATAFFSIYDQKNKLLTYSNGGHFVQYIIRGEEQEIELKPNAMPLGFPFDTTFISHEVQLEVGDRLLLYTDGVTEASNKTGEQFGNGRLRDCIKKQIENSVATAGETLFEELKKFVSPLGFDDDVSLLLVKIT